MLGQVLPQVQTMATQLFTGSPQVSIRAFDIPIVPPNVQQPMPPTSSTNVPQDSTAPQPAESAHTGEQGDIPHVNFHNNRFPCRSSTLWQLALL